MKKTKIKERMSWRQRRRKEIVKLINELKKHCENDGLFQIHLNSGNFEGRQYVSTGVEFFDIYFDSFDAIADSKILSFSNRKSQPINEKEDGTPLYDISINSGMFIDTFRIEHIAEMTKEEDEDWFICGGEKVFNVYLYPENNHMTGNRNIISIGLL